ncbi:hypothetical protein AAFN86_10045 [Roseomonas sp. CAU 1739]|uniref:hypothetical protein n=1 Tax=Roseomonas sp. CAU 1739 TaxID=3140364 RepID=UPI00325A7E31
MAGARRRCLLLGLPGLAAACSTGDDSRLDRLEPGRWPPHWEAFAAETTSRRTAALPPLRIEPPGADVPAALRVFSGRWHGWGGINRSQSVAIAVTALDVRGGRGMVARASDSFAPRAWAWRFRLLEGFQITGLLAGAPAQVTLAPRPDGAMDLAWTEDDPEFNLGQAEGVLTRVV